MLAAGVRRRRLKFGGIVYHLYHPDPPRGESDNHPLYEEAVRTNARWCTEGLDRHLRDRVAAGAHTGRAAAAPHARTADAHGADVHGADAHASPNGR
jgi:hypothetical protein